MNEPLASCSLFFLTMASGSFLLSAALTERVGDSSKRNLIAWGLACLAISQLVQKAGALKW